MPHHPLLRPGNQADAKDFLVVQRDSILELGPMAYTKQECESWASGLKPLTYVNAMTSGGETFLVAEIDSSVVGFCSFKANEVIGLYVHPTEVRKGIGSFLLDGAESAIVRDRETTIRLNAALSALKFYRSHYYRVQSHLQWKTRGGLEIQACTMSKNFLPHSQKIKP